MRNSQRTTESYIYIPELSSCWIYILIKENTLSLMGNNVEDLVDQTRNVWHEIKSDLATLLKELVVDYDESENRIPNTTTDSTVSTSNSLQKMKSNHTELHRILSSIQMNLYEENEELKLKKEIDLLVEELDQKTEIIERCRNFLNVWKDEMICLGETPLLPVRNEDIE